MAERELPKLAARVRFPSPAPKRTWPSLDGEVLFLYNWRELNPSVKARGRIRVYDCGHTRIMPLSRPPQAPRSGCGLDCGIFPSPIKNIGHHNDGRYLTNSSDLSCNPHLFSATSQCCRTILPFADPDD